MGAERRPVIRVRDLVGGYGQTVILKGVSFEVGEGEIVVIVGGSGCGKSTLLKHIIGLNPPLGGSVEIDGINVGEADDATYRDLVKKIGVLYQGAALLGSLTVGENVALPLFEHTSLDKKGVDMLVRLKLATVDLDGYEGYLPDELSGGMKKRAGLARAMALNPSILFFDEPSAGLDPITASDLDRLILLINRTFNTTMVIVTHELRSIFAIADRAILLDKKVQGVVAVGDPRVLKEKSDDPMVRRFFNPAEEMKT